MKILRVTIICESQLILAVFLKITQSSLKVKYFIVDSVRDGKILYNHRISNVAVTSKYRTLWK